MSPEEHHKFTRFTPFALFALLALLGGVYFTVISTQQNTDSRSKASTVANMVTNGGFESGSTGWQFNKRSTANGTFTTTTSHKTEGIQAAQINVTAAGSNPWELEIAQYGKAITAGQTYTVSFSAKASAARTIDVVIQNSNSPFTEFMRRTASLSTSWQPFTYTFVASQTQANTFVGFQFAKATGTVWVDDVKFYIGTAVTPTMKPTIAPTIRPTMTPTPYMAAPTPTRTPTPYPPTPTRYVPTPTITPTLYPPTPTRTIVTPILTQPIATLHPPTPTVTPSPTLLPTATPYPTATPVPGATKLAMELGLHGIGKGGDSTNPNSLGNFNIQRPQRQIEVQVFNSQNVHILTKQGNVSFDTVKGTYSGILDIGTTLTSGLYTIKVKTNQHLRALVPGIHTVIQGQTVILPKIALVTGDINNDNAINILDYNILMGCYSDLMPAVNCAQGDNIRADINDDSNVNQFDYNLFLRELTNIGGQ